MKIRISRAFSKKVQVKQFEPIESFCAAEIEMEITPDKKHLDSSDLEKIRGAKEQSGTLDNFVRAEVEKTIQSELAKSKNVDKQKSTDVGQEGTEFDAGIDHF